jgi:hypothetical protein
MIRLGRSSIFAGFMRKKCPKSQNKLHLILFTVNIPVKNTHVDMKASYVTDFKFSLNNLAHVSYEVGDTGLNPLAFISCIAAETSP